MRAKKLLYALLMGVVSSTFMGCDSVNQETQLTQVGYLVAPFDSNVHYQCGEKRATLTPNGKFTCTSFPVEFYVNNESIGQVSSIHPDGYVFPQDLTQTESSIEEFIALAIR